MRDDRCLVVRAAVEVSGGTRADRIEAASLVGAALAEALRAPSHAQSHGVALHVLDGGRETAPRGV